MRTLFLLLILSISAAAQGEFDDAVHQAQTGRYEQALSSFRAIAVSKPSARASFNIGACLYRLERYGEAADELKAAVAQDPGYQKAWYALGKAYMELNEPRAAASALQKAVELDKKDAEAWFDLGLVLLAENDMSNAYAAFQRSIEFKTVSAADAHNNLGVIMALQGDISGAIKKFKLVSGDSAEARANLEVCLSYVAAQTAGAPSGTPRVFAGYPKAHQPLDAKNRVR